MLFLMLWNQHNLFIVWCYQDSWPFTDCKLCGIFRYWALLRLLMPGAVPSSILGQYLLHPPGPWFNIKMSSHQYRRKSHCGDSCLISTMGWFPILIRWHLYIESAPRYDKKYLLQMSKRLCFVYNFIILKKTPVNGLGNDLAFAEDWFQYKDVLSK